MPTYVYEIVLPDGSGGGRFERIEPMSDPPLTRHPETGEPVRRVLTTFAIGGSWAGVGAKGLLSNRNLEEKGFTKYVRTGEGTYEKQVGKGPDTLGGE